MWTVIRAAALIAVLVLAGACRGRGGGVTPPAADDRLALFPADTQLVIAMDLAKMRQASVAPHLASLKRLPLPPFQAIDAVNAKTGFDVWRGVDSVMFAGGKASDEYGLVIRGTLPDSKRLESAARDLLAARGDDLVVSKAGRFTVWSSRERLGVDAFLIDDRTLVIGAGGWTERIAELAQSVPPPASAATNAGLATALAGAQGHGISIVGDMPDDMRAAIAHDTGVVGAAQASRVVATVDLDDGIRASLAVDLASAEAADLVAEAAAKWLVSKRRRPEMDSLLKGMTTYVENATFRLTLEMSQDVVTNIGDNAALLFGLERPKPAAEAPGTEPQAIKFTPVSDETWSHSVAVSDIRTFSRMGQSFAVMEVVNRVTKPIVPTVAVVYRDRNGRNLRGESCLLPALVVLPRERMPCMVPTPAGAAAASFTVGLAPDGKAAELAGLVRADVKILDARLESPPGPSQLVVGKVMNGTQSTLRGVRVQASFYDASRKLVGFAMAEIPQALKPGERLPFEVRATMLSSAAKSFSATAFVVPQNTRR